ncbi:MAG: glycogen synthase GlgA [Lachnospiraceae bacterium]
MTKILFAAFEAAPFVKTGGLGDVAGSLPAAIFSSAFDVRVVLPKLSAIPERYVKKMEFITAFSVPLGWRNQYCGLFRLKHKGILYYFLDNEYYFKRDQVYGEFDDGERVAFFSKAVLEFILSADEFVPDIIHCNDWHTALVPVLLREQYMDIPEFTRIKTVFTIHNLKFQGKFSDFVIGDICGLAKTPAAAQLLSDKHTANYLQGAAIYCDRITTVSPTYAEEICMPYYGEGLDWLFNRRKDALSGILNGIDYQVWNPAKDKKIPVNYDVSSLAKKHENKLLLQKELGLEVKKEIPLFVIISRLTEQKGMDLVSYLLPEFQQHSMQLAVLGIGDQKYENAFLYYAGTDPQKFSASVQFNNDLAHRMYAGADVVLMPSRFEPCGLTQMIAMRYGTLPLVRETGGLKDTVHVNNGFSFLTFNAQDMLYAVDCALDTWFNRKRRWITMQKEAMAEDYSWKASAKEYRKLYCELMHT